VRAALGDNPITLGTTTVDCRRRVAAACSSAIRSLAARATALSTVDSPAGSLVSSRSRQRSQADCRVTPSLVAISAHDLRLRRAVRTAPSSAWSSWRRMKPMSANASSAPLPSAGE
jgi:hypothetical protein